MALASQAQTTAFTPGRLAVLRIGNGQPAGYYDPAQDWSSKQNADYIDEFLPNVSGPTAPTLTFAFPTNGANALWNNGNAGSEADSMARSADNSILTYSAYTGDIGSIPGTPSSLPYHRILSAIDAFTNNQAVLVRDDWYGIATGKTNPRGVVSDGTNSFWGSGNNGGTLFYNPAQNDGAPVEIQNFTPTRAVKIINNAVYTTITGKDSNNTYPCGIFNFIDFYGNPSPMPNAFAGFHLVVPAATKYTNISGFYMNKQQTIAYMADQVWGVQKYVKSGGSWQYRCNFNVQGGEQTATKAFFVTNDIKNSVGGAWDVVADFSGTNPVLYAVTCDFSIYSGNFNSNRVVRIVDTNTAFSSVDITNFTVIAQAYGTNIGFRAIDFTPDLRPTISSVSADQSVVSNTSVAFSISANESGTAASYSSMSYQWYKNGSTVLSGQTGSTLTLTPSLSDNGNTYQCVVSNSFGTVTSAPPANLTVTSVAQPPVVSNGGQLITNAIGDNVAITVNASGTTPLSYQWYVGNPAAGGTPLSDVSEYSGTATATLAIGNAQLGIDDTNYYCVLSNVAGSATNLIATLKLVYTPPVFSSTPGSITILSNTDASFSCTIFGTSPSYQWYTSNKVAIAGATLPSLTINPATTNQGYYVVVTNLGGAITSAVATVTVVIPPQHSYVNYTNAGQLYVQNFDSLPVVTNTTVNTGNPVLILQVGSASGVTYGLDNPFDFAYPVISSGTVGGLGLTNTMKGWYGAGSVASKLGAHQGDQSTGGLIDYGVLTNANSGEINRALGLQSTSTTGNSAMGLKLINSGTNGLAYVTIQFIGELWRNQPGANTLEFGYYIDTDTNNAFTPTNALANLVPNLFVSFAPSVSLTTVDGSQPANQITLAVTNLNIGSWPTNTALWLVWQQTNSLGSAQGLAIDNLSFTAASTVAATVIAPLTITAGSIHLTGSGAAAATQFTFTNAPGLSFSVLATNNITAPKTNWPVIGTAIETSAGQYQFTDPNPATNTTRFYILRQP